MLLSMIFCLMKVKVSYYFSNAVVVMYPLLVLLYAVSYSRDVRYECRKKGHRKKGTGKMGTEKRAQEKWAQEKRAQVKN